MTMTFGPGFLVRRPWLAVTPLLAPGLAAAQSSGLEEIIVTAQFREQNVQQTPISISAFDSTMLDARAATDINDAANLAPNVTLTRGATGFGQMSAIFIRGVGQADPHFAVEPGVGMYIDDVYFGVLTGSIFELLDTERVEVLRGPQGTLAGKNSIGGAIKLFSQQPGPDANGYAEFGYGTFDGITGRAATNLTIAEDKLYARVSVMARQRDGYVDRLDYNCASGQLATGTRRLGQDCQIGTQGGESMWAARGVLRWTPGERVDNSFSFDITADNSENPAAKQIFQSPLWAGTANYITGPEDYTNYEDYISRPTGTASTPFVLPESTPLDVHGFSNNLSIQFSDTLQLQSITAVRQSETPFAVPADVTPATVSDQAWRLTHDQFTQEFRLNGGAADGVEWTVGYFTYDADGVSEGRVNLPGGFLLGGGGLNLEILFRDPVKTESDSLFAHAAFRPGDNVTITTGVRYTEDLKSFTFNRWDWRGLPHPLLGALVDFNSTYEGDRTDYRVAVDWQFADNMMVYGQVSTGYKGGGVNPRPFFPSQAIPYNPEELEALEVGFKSVLADNRLRFNAAVFKNDFQDLQLTLTRCDAFSPFPGAPCAMSANVGDADITGVEVEVEFRPVEALTIDLALGFLDFEYSRVDPLTFVTLDMTTVYVPDEERSLGIQYEVNLANGGRLTPRLDYNYRSEIQTAAINQPTAAAPTLPSTLLDDLSLWNFRLNWDSPTEVWSAALTVTNLTDEFYYESQFGNGLATNFSITRRPGWPRETFLTVKRRFE
jgi:iron complex outermembrane recepter protein